VKGSAPGDDHDSGDSGALNPLNAPHPARVTAGAANTGAPGSGQEQREQVDAQARSLLALYAALDAETAALCDAVEQGRADELPALVATREARLNEAARRLAELGPQAARLPAGRRQALLAALRDAQRQDEVLHALLAARLQEIPAQLATLRAARRALAGYGLRPGTLPSVLDQKG
jgi:hypothetical protein